MVITRASAGSSRMARRAVIVGMALGLLACNRARIPNTDVEDTSDNRQVIFFCERYRKDLEDRNVGDLLKMMSPAYFETGGNVRSADDADYEKITEFLTGDFLKTSAVRYEIRYRRVTFTEQSHIYIDYTYAAAWKIPGLRVDEWHHRVADNRLDLVRDGESFKIVKGM
jgi:hypothetical protein